MTGQAGTTGHAGTGGPSDAGAGDASDARGNVCAEVAAVDRSCAVDADCLAGIHTINCCGSAVWIGFRSSEKDRFASLEAACDKTYPACGCASGPPTTDDGSIVPFGTQPGVTCQGGVCRTFSKACGKFCETGRACVTCKMGAATTPMGFCSLRCMQNTGCTEPGRSMCQVSFTGGVCVDPAMTCGAF
jgi:hypothetical protein